MGDGWITNSDLGPCLRTLGERTTNAELLEMLSYQDKDSSGVIDFMEFLKLMEKRARMAHKMDEYKSIFNTFDKDRKSMVSEVEIRYIVRKHPTLSKMPAQLLDDVILQADT